jgi:hypothetical protein
VWRRADGFTSENLRRWLNTFEAERTKVEFINEGLDHANRIILGDVVIEAGWQHRLLTAILTFHKSAHASLHERTREAERRVALLDVELHAPTVKLDLV